MAEYKDYYKILGVGKTATDAEIKKAFKQQARKCHPDLHPEAEKAKWTEKFKDLNEAYTVLSDKQKRTIMTKWAKKATKIMRAAAGLPAAVPAQIRISSTNNTAISAADKPAITLALTGPDLTEAVLVTSSKAFSAT